MRPGWQTALASFGGLNPCPDMPITVWMRFSSVHYAGMDEKHHGAQLGVGIVASCSALVLATVWFLPTTNNGRSVALAFVGVGMVISVALSKLAWERLPVQALLIFPALGIVGITTIALLNTGITPAYTGFFTIAIFFVGSTQSERVTLASIAIALPCWIVCQGGLTATVGVKVPVMVGVWALIGITLARRAVRSSALTDELIRVAATDPLTGLASRGELVRLLGLVEEGDAVVLLDLDEFKALNDVRGHQAGDDALAAFGTIVREVLRSGDVAIRYGGDEILLVLTRAGSAGADATLERLCARWSGVDHPTFSAGVAVCHHSTPTETLRRADKALYEAKQRGRNRWSHAEQVGPTGHLKVVQ